MIFGEPLHHRRVAMAEEARGLSVESGDLRHLVARKAEIEHVKVLFHAFAMHGLLQQPATSGILERMQGHRR